MQWKTHIWGGAVAGGVILTAYINKDFSLGSEPLYLAPAILGMSVLGGLFPDIDLETSKVGQHAKTMSFIINRFFGHRTIFHAPLLYILVYMLLKEHLQHFHILLLAFTAGALSHIVLDMLNAKGIPLLYPAKGNYHVAKVKNGGKVEKAILHTLLITSIIIEIRHLIIAFSFLSEGR